jgi:hypothetical protein
LFLSGAGCGEEVAREVLGFIDYEREQRVLFGRDLAGEREARVREARW